MTSCFCILLRAYRYSHICVVVSDTNGPGDFDALLLKDAVYCSVGLAAHDLYDFIDFQQWFEKKLISEATEGGSRHAIHFAHFTLRLN